MYQQIPTIDICVCGAHGMTPVVYRFVTGIFSDCYFPVPDDNFSRVISVDGQLINIKITVLIEEESFGELRYSYYEHSQGFILCYDIYNHLTLDNVKDIYNEIMEVKEGPFPCVICGFNAEFRDEKDNDFLVPLSEVEKMREEFGCEVIEVSARTGKNIDKLFETIASKFIIKDEKNEKPDTNAKPKQKGKWEIGLLSSTRSDAVNIAKNYVFGEFSEKMSDDELTKVVEVNNEIVSLSFNMESLITSNYFFGSVDGAVFIASIKENMEVFKKSVQNAKSEFKDLPYVIAADHCKLDKNDDKETSLYKIYKELEDELDTKIFVVSCTTGENLEEMFFYLAKKISIKRKKSGKFILRKKKR